MNAQYKKGVVEICVLSILSGRDCYGYDISEYLSNHIGISDGTVYPILRKLKSDGLVTTYLQEESGGPPRKYYKLTEAGREELARLTEEWFEFTQSIDKLLKGEFGNYDSE